jgi:acyl-CoA synthetase (AMP-forming)/AMP-acid ligase II
MHDRGPLLPQILALNGRWRAGRPALVTDEETLDWAVFDGRTRKVANALLAAGCRRGDRVALVMENGAAMAEALFGAMRAGLAVAPLNPSVADEALDGMLADAGARVVLASEAHRARLEGPGARAAALRICDGDAPSAGWSAYVAWREAAADEEPHVELGPDDLCNIIYSSGTTGRPKGIAHTHGARLAWTHDLAHALRYHSAARTLLATGLYSNITWAGMLPTLMLGGRLVVRRRFDAADVLETLERERITHTSMVPVQYQRLLDHPDFPSSSRRSMQAMMCCGAPLPVAVKERLFETFPCGVTELYGSTEGIITTLAPEEAAGRMASVGKPLPGEDLVILGEDDRVLPRGQAGEIAALSRFAMQGYWNNPEATAEAFWTDAGGRRWLRSGDIGRIDAEGYLHITDRKKDMILSGGQNVYPADLEAVLMSHPLVADCAVFGAPSERWGETPLALVVLRPGAAIGESALRDWANSRLGRQQRIDRVEFRDGLPRNANGKVLKRELRAPYWSEGAAP